MKKLVMLIGLFGMIGCGSEKKECYWQSQVAYSPGMKVVYYSPNRSGLALYQANPSVRYCFSCDPYNYYIYGHWTVLNPNFKKEDAEVCN